jgi:hypothetical protein
MILALQYCENDVERSLKLAMLLADLEPSYRSDVVLALVRDSSFTPRPADIYAVIRHCSTKFPIEHVILPQANRGWPRGPNQQWAGMMEHFARKQASDLHAQLVTGIGSNHRYDSIFIFDGGDGVPLHRGWIDLLKAEHARTTKQGKLVTGTIGIDNTNRFHINGNVVMETEIWQRFPDLHDCPDHDAWDCYHFQTLVPRASLSTVVHNTWRYQDEPARNVLSALAQRSLWWHGCKSKQLCDVARSYLLDPSTSQQPPVLQRWEKFSDYDKRTGIRHKPWVNGHDVSITTGSMNCRDVLKKTLPTWTRSDIPNEILIVDWSSSGSLRDLAEMDPRIIVVCVIGQESWHCGKCRNLELRLARGGIVLQLDNSYLLSPNFFIRHPLAKGSFYAENWQEIPDTKKRMSKILYAHRDDLFEVNGYSERSGECDHVEDDLYDRLSETGLKRLSFDLQAPEHTTKQHDQSWGPSDHMTRWCFKQVADQYYECAELLPGEIQRDLPWRTIE